MTIVGVISPRAAVNGTDACPARQNQKDEAPLDVTAQTAKAAATTAMDNVKSFIAGGFGGASAVLVGSRAPPLAL